MANPLGDDIKEVLSEVGVGFTLYRQGSSLGTGHLEVQQVKQGSKPFMIEHFQHIRLPYDTSVDTGDVLKITASGEYFLVMNKSPEIFEDQIISQDVITYKTNAVATLLRGTGTRNTTTYQMVESFVSYKTGVPVLVVDKMYGSIIDEAQNFGQFAIRANEVYIPGYTGIKSLDRISLSNSEFYKIEQIETRRFDGAIWVCTVTEDTRGA